MLEKLKKFLFVNTTTKQTVAKNTFWLTFSNFGGRLLKSTVVIYAARSLGASEWGVFSYAVTLAGFLTLFIDPGINGILMRDASRASEEDRKVIFSTTLAIKLCLLIAAVLIIAFIAPFFSTLPGAKALLPIVAFILAFDTLREFLSALLRAEEKMEWEAGIFIFMNVAIVAFSFLFLWRTATAQSFGTGYAIGTAFGAGAAIIVLRRYFKNVFSHFSLVRVWPILGSAWPFAITGALGLLLTNADILIISWMRSAADVGIYSAVIRVIQIFYLVPTIIQFSTMPLLARLAKNDNDKFRSTLEHVLGITFIVSVPIAVGGAILGPQIMYLVFGSGYITGGVSFKILTATMLVDYPAAIISGAIFVYNQQKSLIVTSAIAGTANVLLDLLLIPHFGITGSAVATLIAQVISNAYLWHMMKKINDFSVMSKLKKIFAAGVVMGIISLSLRALGVPVFVNVFVDAAVYFGMLVASREPLLVQLKGIFKPAA